MANTFIFHVEISGSWQAIKVVEELMEGKPFYEEFTALLAATAKQAILETGKLGKKKVEVAVREDTGLAQARYGLKYAKWLGTAGKEDES